MYVFGWLCLCMVGLGAGSMCVFEGDSLFGY